MKIIAALLAAVLIFAQTSHATSLTLTPGASSDSDTNYVAYGLLAAAVIILFWVGSRQDRDDRARAVKDMPLYASSETTSLRLVSPQTKDQNDASAGLAFVYDF
jgi:hypothetical protein